MYVARIAGGWLLVASVVATASAVGSSTPLIDAIKAGDRQAVRGLSRRPADVNAIQPDGTTALHWAVRADDLETVQLLLHSGARVNVANRYGVTPLMMAATSGNVAVLDALLAAGADASAALPEGETVLMTAARMGKPEALNALIVHGADVNAEESWLGETAVMWAAALDHASAVRVLLENGADPNAHSKATEFKRKIAGQTALPRGGFTALMYAARQGAMEAARVLVDGGADPNAVDPEGTNALVLAIINAHYDLAVMLLEKGANPNVADETGMAALYAAVDMHTLPFMHGRPDPRPSGKLDSLDVVNALLAHGADLNQALTSPILRRHNTPSSQFLGAGTTPLMRAAKTGDVTLMRLLLDKGADPNLRQKNGTTLLMLAAGYGRRFNHNNDSLEFERATEEELLAAVKLCVELGLDVNGANDTGETALFWAGRDAIKFLVNRGARIDATNEQGKTALDAALARRDGSGRQLRPGSVVALRELGATATRSVGQDTPDAPQ